MTAASTALSIDASPLISVIDASTDRVIVKTNAAPIADQAATNASRQRQRLNRPCAQAVKHICTDGIELTLEITPALPCFDGHFDDCPVVPGVVQIDWAVHYASSLLHLDWPVSRVDRLKFMCPVQPNVFIALKLIFNREKQWLDFQFFGDNQIYSKGRLVYDNFSD